MDRFIHVRFERGITQADYDKFMEAVLDLADVAILAYPEDCDNDIWVSGGGAVEGSDG